MARGKIILKLPMEDEMRKKLIVFLAVLLVSLFSAILMAESEGKNEKGFAGNMFSPKMVLSMALEINLSDAQFNKIKEVIKNSPAEKEDEGLENTERNELKAEIEKDSPDKARIDAILSKMANERLAEMKADIDRQLSVRSVLTKGQIEIIKQKAIEEGSEENGAENDGNEND
jgi:Spy/CpxP family protein refolding chaperone